MPPLRRLLVAPGHEVAPGGGAREAVVDGRAHVVDLVGPGKPARALDGLEPDAAHLRLHLAMAVGPHAAARAVAQRLRALHRAREPGRVEDALAAHVATEDRLLDRGLDECDRLHHAGTALRLRWIRSFARRAAADASEAYPSAPTLSAYSCVTGAPPTITITSSRIPAFSSALMFALNIGIVVVRKAEKPTMSGLCSCTISTNVSGATLTPRSWTVKPAPSSMMLTRFLPMSWTSPLTVPIT